MTAAPALLEDLSAMPAEQLVSLVVHLRQIVAEKIEDLSQARNVVNDLIDERDAARLLNELCHY
jgi:anthranilate phosphoribosyltransferase